MTDHRIGLDLFTDILDVLHRHGFARGDDQHAGRAIFLISDLARIYEGSQDHPFGPYINQAPSPAPIEPPGPDSRNAVIVPATETGIIAAALDEAADYKRDRAATCADCTDRSCGTCQWRLRGAETYGHLATQMLWVAGASRGAADRQPTLGDAYPSRSQPQTAADKEAGQ